MFNKLRLTPSVGQAATAAAIDALWRICLRAGNDAVATQAMNDLLAVYIANNSDNQWVAKHSIAPDQMQTDEEESFGKRVFDCLENVNRSAMQQVPLEYRQMARALRNASALCEADGSR